ncbi:hemolysin E [Shigella flexneri]
MFRCRCHHQSIWNNTSYSLAQGVHEGKLVPELKNKLKSCKFLTTLSNTVKQANKDIDAPI